MADNPRIELEYDASGASKAALQFNKDQQAVEKQAVKTQESIEKSTEKTAQGILRVVDTSKRSVQTLLASAERRVAALKSPQAALRVRQDSELKRVDPLSKDRLLAIQLEERQILKQREMNALLSDAQKGSQRANQEADKFTAALARANSQAKQLADNTARQAKELRESTLAAAETRLAALKSPQDALKLRQSRELSQIDSTGRGQLQAIHAQEQAIAKQREMNALLAAAQKGSQQQNKEAEKFATALTKANVQAKQLADTTARQAKGLRESTLAAAQKDLASLQGPQAALKLRQQRQLSTIDEIGRPDLLKTHAQQDAIQKQKEMNALLDAAVKGSQRQNKEAEKFSAALTKANVQAKQLRDNTVATAERRALSTQSPLTQLGADRAGALKNVAGDPAAIDRVTASYNRLLAVEKQQIALRTADEFGRIGKALTIGVTLPLTAAGLAALHSSEQYNKATAAFTQMLGGAEQAKRFLGELQQFALTTPFEFADLVPAAQRLKALGFEAKAIIPIMRAVGEATAATGGSGETFDRITLALGQIQSKGRVMAQEMNQLTEALVPAWDILAKKIGVSIPEAMKMVEKGAISASVAVPAILQGMLKEYAGQMQKQNELLSGQFSNLKDQFRVLLRDVGNALTPLASRMVQFGLSAVSSLSKATQWFLQMPSPIRNATIGVTALLALLGPLTTAASAAAKAMLLLWGTETSGNYVGSIAAIRSLQALPVALVNIRAQATGTSIALTAFETKLAAFPGVVAGAVGAVAPFLNTLLALIATMTVFSRMWNETFGERSRDVEDAAGHRFSAGGDALKKRFEAATKAAVPLSKQVQDLHDQLQKVAGIDYKRGNQSLEDYRDRMQEFLDAWKRIGDISHNGPPLIDPEEAIRAKELAAAVKRSADVLRQAQLGELTGLEKNREKYQQLREELHLTDAEVNKLSGSQRQAADAARKNLAQGELIDAQKIARKTLSDRAQASAQLKAEELKATQQTAVEREKHDRESIKTIQGSELDLRDMKLRNAAAEYGLQEKYLTASRDSELRSLQQVNAITIDQKVAVEQKKAEIEQRYLQQSLEVKKKLLDADKAIEIAHATGTEQEKAAQIAAINDKYRISEKALVLDTDAEIRAAQENAAIQSNEIIRNQNQQTFDHFKSETERTIDAVGRLWTSGFSSMAKSMKTLLLGAFRDIISSQVARLLYQASGGGSVSFARGATGGSGLLGNLLGKGLGLGALPVFGAGGFTGGPGGTAPYSGASGGAAGTATTGLAGLKASSALQVSQYKGILTALGNLGPKGYSAAGTWVPGAGVHGLAGGAMLLGGGILGFDGLRRGGLAGFGETTAGGALIGAKFGGPMGALIGAGIGAIAGLVGLFRTSAEEKLVKAVKRLYGFDIDKSFAKNSLLPIIQQQFGGDIEAGLRAQQVRELIQLYAMSRGLSTQGILPTATPSVFASSGGTFTQVPTFQNGSAVLAGSSQSVSAAAPSNVTVQMDGPTTQRFLQGQAVQTMAANPRKVSQSATKGQIQRGSRQSLASQFQPNFII